MTDANVSLMWIVWFRTLQGALEAAPTLLCGLLIAGLIRGIVGPAAVRRWLTDDPRVGPVRAWLTGILLPVCSLGVLPIAWELRRAGVPRATVLTFLLAAPLADPFSLTYAFGKLETHGAWGLAAFVFLVLGTFVVPVGAGVLLGLWMREEGTAQELPALPTSELQRVGVTSLTAARGLSGELLPFMMLGLLGSGLLALVRGGALERTINDSSSAGPLHLALASIPFYVPSAHGMVVVCDLLLGGESVGKALVFFQLGLGLNVGTLAWIAWNYGFRVFTCAVAIVAVAAVTCGYALPLSLPGAAAKVGEPHHFLEIETGGTVKTARQRAIRTTVTSETGQRQWFLIGACGAVAGLAIVGLFSRALGDIGSPDYWMRRNSAAAADPITPAWNKTLSGPQLALAAIVIALVAAVAGSLVYYPAPDELLNQMDEVQMELGKTLKAETINQQSALRLLDQLQKLQQKLVVADLLRRWKFDDKLRVGSEELGQSLERLRVAVVERQTAEELEALYRETRQAAARCSEALDDRPRP